MSQPTTTRRRFLSAAIAAPALLSAPAAESTGDTRLRHEHELPGLAVDFAEWERHAVQEEYPGAWYRMHYITTIRFNTSVSLTVGFGPPARALDSCDQARAALVDAAVPILASGWSEDGSVWSLFIKADVAPIRELMSKIAPPIHVWKAYSTWKS